MQTTPTRATATILVLLTLLAAGAALVLFAPDFETQDSDASAPASVAATAEIHRSGTGADLGADAPVFDPEYVPGPPDINVRAAGPDFGFQGTASTGGRPPDPEIAVGPTHVVLVVNARIVIRRKSDGVETFSQNLGGSNSFWSDQGVGFFVFDPIAQFDPHTERFVVAAAEHTGGEMFLNIAISAVNDPSGWVKHRVNMTQFGTGMDYPILGVDEQSISITCNFFGDPLASWIFIFDKAQLIAGVVSLNPVQVSEFNPPTGAMTNYDPGPPAQYYASTWSAGNNRLRLMAVTDPNGTPALSEFQLLVPRFLAPRDAEQLGTTNLADTVDWRIKHGIVRNGSMWVAHNTMETEFVVGGGPFDSRQTTKVRWHEIALNGWPTSGNDPTLAQSGLIDEGFGVFTWCADISADDNGNAGIVFNRSSADELISVNRAVRRVTDPPGMFRQAVIMQESTTPEFLDRWGDYAGIQEDPVEPGVFWGHSEYRTSAWRTWVGRFSPLTPNPLDFTLLSPLTGAEDVALTPMLDWEDAEDAVSYEVVIATDPELLNTVATTSVSGSGWIVPSGLLSCGVQYYWGVVASGVGGDTGSTPGAFEFTTGLLADLNDDGIIDTADLGLLIAAFGSSEPSVDINGDGVVDTADLGLLVSGFGATCN